MAETTGAGAATLLPIPLTIRNIAEVHRSLSSALAAQDDIVLDIPAGADVDISFVQLVVAARKSAAAAGKSIRLKHEAEGTLRDLLSRGGFLRAEGAEFWRKEAQQQ